MAASPAPIITAAAAITTTTAVATLATITATIATLVVAALWHYNYLARGIIPTTIAVIRLGWRIIAVVGTQ